MLFENITIRLLASDDFPVEAKRRAAADLTTIAPRITVRIAQTVPLAGVAEAHDLVAAGIRGRVVLAVGDAQKAEE